MSASSSTWIHSPVVRVRKTASRISRNAARFWTRRSLVEKRPSSASSGMPRTSHSFRHRSGLYAATITYPSRVGKASLGAA